MRRYLIVPLAVVVALAVPAAASAHSTLQDAAPKPGQAVAPGFATVALLFSPLKAGAPVTVTLTGPDNRRVPAQPPVKVGDTVLCLHTDTVRTPGVYAVDYDIESADNEHLQSRFYFEVKAGKPAVSLPQECADHAAARPDEPLGWQRFLLPAVIVLAVLVGGLFYWRRQRRADSVDGGGA